MSTDLHMYIMFCKFWTTVVCSYIYCSVNVCVFPCLCLMYVYMYVCMYVCMCRGAYFYVCVNLLLLMYVFSSHTQSGLSPAMIAASNGHKEVLEVLIDRFGCSPEEQVHTTSTQCDPYIHKHSSIVSIVWLCGRVSYELAVTMGKCWTLLLEPESAQVTARVPVANVLAKECRSTVWAWKSEREHNLIAQRQHTAWQARYVGRDWAVENGAINEK